MRFLYPCDPFNKKEPDETYAEEFFAAQAAGLACSLYSAEDFESGEFKPHPRFAEGDEIVYRGWMLSPNGYARLLEAIEHGGARALTSVAQYRFCHYLPEWYPRCKELTPETVIVKKGDDYAAAVADRHWPAFFVKDYVKSLTTSRGSVANSAEEIAEIVSLIEKYRGRVEGASASESLNSWLSIPRSAILCFAGRLTRATVSFPKSFKPWFQESAARSSLLMSSSPSTANRASSNSETDKSRTESSGLRNGSWRYFVADCGEIPGFYSFFGLTVEFAESARFEG